MMMMMMVIVEMMVMVKVPIMGMVEVVMMEMVMVVMVKVVIIGMVELVAGIKCVSYLDPVALFVSFSTTTRRAGPVWTRRRSSSSQPGTTW